MNFNVSTLRLVVDKCSYVDMHDLCVSHWCQIEVSSLWFECGCSLGVNLKESAMQENYMGTCIALLSKVSK